MPLIEVHLIEKVFNPEQKRQIIQKLTDAMVSVEGENMASVNFWMICRFCSGLNTFRSDGPRSMALSSSSMLTSPMRGRWRHYALRGQSRLSESHDLVSTCPLDTRDMCLADA